MVASIILQILLRLRPYPMSCHRLLCKEMHTQSGSVLQHTHLGPINDSSKANKRHAQSSTAKHSHTKDVEKDVKHPPNVETRFDCPQAFRISAV